MLLNKFKKPTSNQKHRKGKKRKDKANIINISDFDTNTCFLGVVKNIIDSKNSTILNLLNNTTTHCHGRSISTRNTPISTPVVFSKISDKNGEILAYYTTDHLDQLCTHFKINSLKAHKEVDPSTITQSNSNKQLSSDIPISYPCHRTSLFEANNDDINNSYKPSNIDEIPDNMPDYHSSDDYDPEIEAYMQYCELNEYLNEDLNKIPNEESNEESNKYKKSNEESNEESKNSINKEYNPDRKKKSKQNIIKQRNNKINV